MTYDIQKAQKELEGELKVLEKEMKSVGRKNPDHPGEWDPKPDAMDTLESDENEVADKFESLEENAGILAELEARKLSVEAALNRIKNGTYGICSVCKKPIEDARLTADASAQTCIEHK